MQALCCFSLFAFLFAYLLFLLEVTVLLLLLSVVGGGGGEQAAIRHCRRGSPFPVERGEGQSSEEGEVTAVGAGYIS